MAWKSLFRKCFSSLAEFPSKTFKNGIFLWQDEAQIQKWPALSLTTFKCLFCNFVGNPKNEINFFSQKRKSAYRSPINWKLAVITRCGKRRLHLKNAPLGKSTFFVASRKETRIQERVDLFTKILLSTYIYISDNSVCILG